MKSINLISLLNAKKNLSPEIFNSYRDNFGFNLKENEYADLNSLIQNIQDVSSDLKLYEGYFIGYTISQISKEFDLLRFGKYSIINIELKKKNTGEKIKRQLLKNQYYLKFLKRETFHFTYVVDEKKLYRLNETGEIEETSFLTLVQKLATQAIEYIENIHTLFNPTDYLVSPFNSTERFIEGHYFLTDQQENIKKTILKLQEDESSSFFTIQGSPGTGKTLLIYDIAKEFIRNSKKVLIIHVGKLNKGHLMLRDNHEWMIAPIKNLNYYNLSSYDLVIIDETQRIYENQLNKIVGSLKDTGTVCIFSFDPKQVLSSWELKLNIPKLLTGMIEATSFTLSEKIRTNKEIGLFIKGLFDLNKANHKVIYPNVDIQYFTNAKDAKEYLEMLESEDWKVINYTPSQYSRSPYDRYQTADGDSAHAVVGQEFDNVAAVLDQYFFYDENGLLGTRNWPWPPYYHPTKMLFQIVTRTRKKLRLVIIDNESILLECLRILQYPRQ